MTLQQIDQGYSIDEFIKIAQQPENEHRHLELIEGEIVEMPPSSKRNTILAARFVRLIGNYVDENNLGYVSGADGGYKVGENYLQPDCAFIASARIQNLDGVYFETAPNLAVEVISESESSVRVLGKARLYLQSGTQAVWAVYPEEQVVHVHRQNNAGELVTVILERDATLTGGDALPEFSLPLSALFKSDAPNETTTD